jgi:SPP1 family predicted phage head-tail adaptor
MKCKSLKKNINKVCIADLDSKIKIQKTSEVYSNNPDTAPVAQFTDIVEMWAMVTTKESFNYIDDVQVGDAVNTEFVIMYTASIDFSQRLYVEYGGVKYKIISANNIDKSNQHIRLRCVELGDKNITANLR